MFAASKTDSVSGAAPDGQFNYVTMLLHGDGTNGAQNNTFIDSSTNAFSITRNGNTTQGSFSPYGSNWSNYFDGTGDYLTTSSSQIIPTGSFTVECFAFVTGSGNNQKFVSQGSSGAAGRFSIGIEGGNWWVQIGGDAIQTGTPVRNQWNYVAVTYNGSTITLYVNGTSIGTVSSTANAQNTTLTIGQDWNSYITTGYISNVRVSNTVRTVTTTPTAPFTSDGNTRLLACQANRFLDSSANAFALTVNGDTSVQRFNPFGTSTAYSTSVIGGSGYFDGNGDNLSAAANSSNIGTGDFNITFWINLTVAPSNGVPATNAYNANAFTNGWYFYTGDGTSLSFGLGSAGGADAVTATVNMINQWHYIEVTRSGSTLSIYVDGVFATSKSNTKSGSVSGNVTRIGARYDGTSGDIQGYITDFKVVVGTAGNTSNYTPPTAPASATGSTLMLSMKNAAIFDNAMMNNLETVGNAQISTSVKKYGTGSLAFDGTGDYLRIPSSPVNTSWSGDWTIEFWLNDTATGIVVYVEKTSGLQIIGISGSIYCYLSSTGSSPYFIGASFGTLTANVWQHIAVVRSGNSYDGYVNGIKTNLGTSSSSANTLAASLTIGASGTGSFPITGYIDDFRVTTGYARYTANFTPPTSALQDTGPY